MPALDRVVAQDFDTVAIDMCLVGVTVMSLRYKLDRAGTVHPQGPLNDIEMVGTPVGILSLAFSPLRRILGAGFEVGAPSMSYQSPWPTPY